MLGTVFAGENGKGWRVIGYEILWGAADGIAVFFLFLLLLRSS